MGLKGVSGCSEKCRVAAAPYPAYEICITSTLPGGGCALPGLRNLHHIDIAGWRLRLTRPTKSAPHRHCRVAASPYPAYKICTTSTLPGGGFALPGLRNLHHIDIAGWRLRLTRPTKSAPHRHCRVAAPPYPAYETCTTSILPGGGSALPGLRNLHEIVGRASACAARRGRPHLIPQGEKTGEANASAA